MRCCLEAVCCSLWFLVGAVFFRAAAILMVSVATRVVASVCSTRTAVSVYATVVVFCVLRCRIVRFRPGVLFLFLFVFVSKQNLFLAPLASSEMPGIL